LRSDGNHADGAAVYVFDSMSKTSSVIASVRNVRLRTVVLAIAIVASLARASHAQEAPSGATAPSKTLPTLTAVRASTPPVIDGTLDDAIWQGEAFPAERWTSYNPLHGSTIPQQTHVWIAYDTRYLYFAFQCDDPEPARIKTSITRRDNIWNDDWVGFSLDALGTGQVSYHLMVNPSGVQLDMLNTSGGGEDTSPDWVWDSAGRLNDKGYAVEIRLPLQSIRFKGGSQVRMGVLFWRRVSRLGMSVSWPDLEPNEWVFQHHAPLQFSDLQARPTRELIPSVVYAGQQERATPVGWAKLDDSGEVGISGKVGLTSTITLDATVNPDFSQVESDAFQVEVNQRFPVFFSEKRPFFMEGAGLFNLAGVGNGDASMVTAVHTRRIVDPLYGAKVTGSLGRFTFGTLVAQDQSAGRDRPEADPLADQDRVFAVGRVQYSLKPGSFAGLILTDTEFGEGFNRVAGADLNLNLPHSQRLTAMVIQSGTRHAETGQQTHGMAAQANYAVSTRRFDVYSQVEHYDRDFQMDTAFYNRTGFTNGWVFAGISFYPDKKKMPWFHRAVPFTFTQGGRDRVQGGDDILTVNGVRLHFSRNGFFRVDRSAGREPFAGERFKIGRTRMFGSVQAFRWLQVGANFSEGAATFYDPTDPYQGRSIDFGANVTLQPTSRFTEDLSMTRVNFDRDDTGADVYDVTIVNSRTTYQFSRQLFVRASLQYDSSQRRVLTDLLGSYELRPGTVLFAGYGSLIERRGFLDGAWAIGDDIPGRSRYLTTRRGLFLKASYLHRF
jgi:hypothetical protein